MKEEAKLVLRLVMEYESEESFAAGWRCDLEFILRERVLACDKSLDELATCSPGSPKRRVAGGAGMKGLRMN